MRLCDWLDRYQGWVFRIAGGRFGEGQVMRGEDIKSTLGEISAAQVELVANGKVRFIRSNGQVDNRWIISIEGIDGR